MAKKYIRFEQWMVQNHPEVLEEMSWKGIKRGVGVGLTGLALGAGGLGAYNYFNPGSLPTQQKSASVDGGGSTGGNAPNVGVEPGTGSPAKATAKVSPHEYDRNMVYLLNASKINKDGANQLIRQYQAQNAHLQGKKAVYGNNGKVDKQGRMLVVFK